MNAENDDGAELLKAALSVKEIPAGFSRPRRKGCFHRKSRQQPEEIIAFKRPESILRIECGLEWPSSSEQ